jgi:hypothetical protein
MLGFSPLASTPLASSAGGDVNVFVSGLEATGAVGSVVVQVDIPVPVTGLEATGAVGTVVVNTSSNIPVTGLEATGAVGTAAAAVSVNLLLNGVQALGEVADVSGVTGTANVFPEGVSAVGQTSAPTVWGKIFPDQDPGWSELLPNQTPVWTPITDPVESAEWEEIEP